LRDIKKAKFAERLLVTASLRTGIQTSLKIEKWVALHGSDRTRVVEPVLQEP
jgi:hypothetical protein